MRHYSQYNNIHNYPLIHLTDLKKPKCLQNLLKLYKKKIKMKCYVKPHNVAILSAVFLIGFSSASQIQSFQFKLKLSR